MYTYFKIINISSLVLLFFSFFKAFAIEDSYQELEKVERKIKFNKKAFNDLKIIENNLNANIEKFEYSVKKYEMSIIKAYEEKEKLHKNIENSVADNNSLFLEIEKYDYYQKRLIQRLLTRNFLEVSTDIDNQVTLNILKNISTLQKNNIELLNYENRQIEKQKKELESIEFTLNNIKSKVAKKNKKIEKMLGETLIAAIQKEEKKTENKNIEKRAAALRKLIERLEKNKKSNKKNNDILLINLKEIFPVDKINIENIRTDKSKTGILLSLKKNALLRAPKNSLVVYADFFKGYGNMVILDLGEGYHLIFSGLSNIFCNTGDWLQKKSVIGDVGIDMQSKDIYMEVRFKGKTVNPNKWSKS